MKFKNAGLSSRTVIRHATVYPSNGLPALTNAAVVVEGGRFTFVGPTSEVIAQPDDIDVDGSGRYAIPGMVNLHEHLDMHRIPGSMHDRMAWPEGNITLNAIGNAVINLAMGVTTVRDLGSYKGTNVDIRDAIDEGRVVGSRVFACGQMISMTGGHGQPICAEADGPYEMRRAVRAQLRRGADVIKVCASGGVVAMRREDARAQQCTQEELDAAVDEAHNFGLTVASHAHPAKAIKASALAGVDTVEHGAFMDDECAELLAAKGIMYVPTIDDSFTVVAYGDELKRPDWMRENAKASLEPRQDSIRRAKAAGVRFGAGTDVAGEMGREMKRLADCGLTVDEALSAGTINGASLLGVEADLGSIEVGKIADLVLLDADPFDDFRACDDSIHWVMKGGAGYRPAELLAAVGGASVVPGLRERSNDREFVSDMATVGSVGTP